MDFTFDSVQTMLRDSAVKLFEDAPLLARLNTPRPTGYSEDLWRQFAELGWFAIGIPEEMGGIGGGAVEAAVVIEEMGRNLVVSPFATSVLVPAQALVHFGTPGQRDALLPGIVDGSLQIAPAIEEAAAVTAQRSGAGYRLSGRKTVVPFGGTATHFLLSALLEDGTALFVVPAAAKGLTVAQLVSIDDAAVADLDLSDVELDGDSRIVNAKQALLLMRHLGIAALAAEVAGAAQALVDTTVDYLKTRKQFGVAIGSFQALQHRAVDMFTRAEFVRSMAWLLASAFDHDPLGAETARIASAAKYLIGEYGKINSEEAIQLHGGMGVTRELPVGHYYKRMVVIENRLGTGFTHLETLIDGIFAESEASRAA